MQGGETQGMQMRGGATSQTGIVQMTHALTLSPLMCPSSEQTRFVRLTSCSQ